MRIYRSVLKPKYFTVKEWKKFNKLTDDYVIIEGVKNYLTMQEVLLAKYQIILKDYKVNPILSYKDLSKKELILKIAKNFNMKNFNKGMKIFNEGVKGFNDSISAVTNQLGHTPESIPRKNHVKLWSNKKNQKSASFKLWSEPKKKKRKYRHKPVQDRDKQNLQSIWGKK